MNAERQPHDEPIPGYRLLELLGRGGYGEVWKCEAPGGLFKAIKFVPGSNDGLHDDGAPADEEFRAVERIKAIRHPFLVSMDRVERLGNELVIVMELADKSLHDLLREYQQRGQPGIPRAELLGYLREAAEALDLLNTQYSLQHLDVKPRNLFLVSNHVKVADFGLVNSSRSANGASTSSIQLGAVTPLYSSPEAMQGNVGRYCDQYSLAVVYEELLTGTLPFVGKSARQMLLLHLQAEPNLAPLPEADRPVVAKALAKDPKARYGSCMELVRALCAANAAEAAPSQAARPTRVAESALGVTPLPRGRFSPTSDSFVGGRFSPYSDSFPAPQSERRDAGALAPRTDGLPGYTFVACVSRSALAETWRAEGPDGRERLVKCLYGLTRRDGSSLADALAKLQALRHPTLLPSEVVQNEPGRLVLVSDFLEGNLRESLQQAQTLGLNAVPRGELLYWLRSVAEALDAVAQLHGVAHLGLNPRALQFEGSRVRIADHGLAHLLWAPAGQPIGRLNGRYSAPELFEKQYGPAADQYSLAMIFHELLTGVHPTHGTSGSQARLDLSRLTPADRELLGRAMSPDPKARLGNCTALVRALEAAGPKESPGGTGSRHGGEAQPEFPSLRDLLVELMAGAGGGRVSSTAGSLSSFDLTGDELEYSGTTDLPLSDVHQLIALFKSQWDAQGVFGNAELTVLHLGKALRFWRMPLGKSVKLEMQIRHRRLPGPGPERVDVQVKVRPCNGTGQTGLTLLQEIGPLAMEDLCTELRLSHERRAGDRLSWPHPLEVRFVLSDQRLSTSVACRGKDLSLSGMAFYLPSEMQGTQIRIDLSVPSLKAPVGVPANIVRVQRCGNGWFEIGACFDMDSQTGAARDALAWAAAES